MRVRVVCLGVVVALSAVAACEDDETISPPATSVTTTGGSAGSSSSVASSVSVGGGGGVGGQATGGTGPQGDWSCLGDSTAPRWSSGPPQPIEASTDDWLGLNAIAGVLVRVCDYTDPSCQNPTAEGTSDSQGIASVAEAVDHRQFYDFSLATVIAPALRFFNGPPPSSSCSMPDLAACECEGCTLPQCDDGNGNFADCTCPQCAADPYCGNPNNCIDDSVCDPYLEGCICTDCMAHPLCGGSGGGGAGGQGGAGGGSSFACVDVTATVPFFFPNPLLSPDNLTEAMQAMGIGEEATRGHIHVEMFDCNGDAPPGVAITVDTADGQSTYGYVGTSGNFEPALNVTSIIGQAGVFNLPPGEAIITPVNVATGETLPVRRVHVRAGTVTYAAAIDAVPEAQ